MAAIDINQLPVHRQETAGSSGPQIENLTETSTNQLDLAARRIQSAWRRHVARPYIGQSRTQSSYSLQLSSETRWDDAILHAEIARGRLAATQGKNDVRSRWKRGVAMTEGLGSRDGSKDTTEQTQLISKVLETQHWLELTDAKHRYGSNLKFYHKCWSNTDTKDNFFKWLDRGDGKAVDLPECPREKLERERILYLSREQRLNYLVKIDEKGLFRWARANLLVDTDSTRWVDAGHGKGIISVADSPDGEGKTYVRRTSFEEDGGTPSMSLAISANDQLKSSKKAEWIFVADKRMNIFVGIKDSGTFQHSSFLSGAAISSAGHLTIKAGLLYDLSPMSGHYRTENQHFQAFITELERRGADLHKLNVAKAEVVLFGFRTLRKMKLMKRELANSLRERLKSIGRDT